MLHLLEGQQQLWTEAQFQKPSFLNGLIGKPMSAVSLYAVESAQFLSTHCCDAEKPPVLSFRLIPRLRTIAVD
jgi:hypothetical protein